VVGYSWRCGWAVMTLSFFGGRQVLPQVVTGVLKGLGTAAGDRKDSRQNGMGIGGAWGLWGAIGFCLFP
jgi:hypothetical protein